MTVDSEDVGRPPHGGDEGRAQREVDAEVGARVARELPSGTPRRDIAASVGMSLHDLEGALAGDRKFTTGQLGALIAVLGLDEDFEYLLTGTSSPNYKAARFLREQETAQGSGPGLRQRTDRA